MNEVLEYYGPLTADPIIQYTSMYVHHMTCITMDIIIFLRVYHI